MTIDEYIDTLEHKQERWEEVAREKNKRKVVLEITKNRMAKEKRQNPKDKKLRAEERAQKHGVMWPIQRCIEIRVNLHEAIRANEPLGKGAYQGPCCGVVHPQLTLNKNVSMC